MFKTLRGLFTAAYAKRPHDQQSATDLPLRVLLRPAVLVGVAGVEVIAGRLVIIANNREENQS